MDSQGIDEAIINAAMAAAEKEQAQAQARAEAQSQGKEDGKPEDDDGPSGPRDFYSVEAADEELAEAQERYAQARARRERFLMEAQANFRKMAEKADEELQAFVDQEEEVAQALERRVKEVKEVKEEVSALVKEADELLGGGKGIMASFDVISALSFLVVTDTFYVSYLAYRGSELLTTSLATEVLLGGFLFFKVRRRGGQGGGGWRQVEGGSVRRNTSTHVVLFPSSFLFFNAHDTHIHTRSQIKQRERAQLEKEKNKAASNNNNNQQRRA
jgi:hypothetical protein